MPEKDLEELLKFYKKHTWLFSEKFAKRSFAIFGYAFFAYCLIVFGLLFIVWFAEGF